MNNGQKLESIQKELKQMVREVTYMNTGFASTELSDLMLKLQLASIQIDKIFYEEGWRK